MKLSLKIAKMILIILLILDVFFWLLAHASGHKIPSKTDWSFGISSLILLILVYLINSIIKKK